jgi:hypothetical protein
MPLDVTFTEDPARVLAEAWKFLAAEPVRNNTMLNLLHGRVSHPEPGRYWLANRDGAVAGAVFQSPLDYPLLVTSIEPDAVTPLVDAIVGAGVSVPGPKSQGAAPLPHRGCGFMRRPRLSRLPRPPATCARP